MIVWIGTLLKLGNVHDYDEWVNALANIASHEVGHTVGFFHPDTEREGFTQYEEDTEIMMAVHTISSLLSKQKFIIPQETCPERIAGGSDGIAYTLSDTFSAKHTSVSHKPMAASQDEVVYCCDLHGPDRP